MASLLCVALDLDHIGGSCSLSANALAVLAERHEVSVLTCVTQDPDRIQALYGVSLQGKIKSFYSLTSSRRFFLACPALLCIHALMRRARQLVPEFDLCVSLHNEMDLGRPILQYIHFPWSYHPRPDGLQYYRNPFIHRALLAYYAVCRAISGYRPSSQEKNFSLANSAWTQGYLGDLGMTSSEVLYPPVRGDFLDRPWSERRNAALCVTRFVPEKRLLVAVSIVEEVRKTIPEFELHLAGSFQRGAGAYRKAILKTAAKRPWVHLHEGLSRGELMELMAQVRYGIHAMQDEHFGIAVAEILTAGCITFAHASAGPQEIIGSPNLLYTDQQDAVDKILRVALDPVEQVRMLSHLESRKKLFAYECFNRKLLQAAERILTGHDSISRSVQGMSKRRGSNDVP